MSPTSTTLTKPDFDLSPLGDRGFLARFDSEARARGWGSAVRNRAWPGVVDVVIAYATVGVLADPDRADLRELERRLVALPIDEAIAGASTRHLIPTLYDGEDLPEVAATLGLTVAEVIATHVAIDYDVQAIGFLPGFPYAGDLPDGLRGLPRRSSPRPRVPAGSVAIVGRQTAIYPRESPGGWHLIGRTPLAIVDLAAARFPIRAGDRLRFMPIDPGEYEARRGELLATKEGGDV